MRWVYSQQQAELVRIGTRSNGWLDCLLVFHHQPMTHDLPDSRWIIKLPQMCFQHSRRTEHYQTHAHFFFGAKPITYYSNNDNCPVIDHGNWGKISRLKRNLLLNANCWSKQQHTVITSSQPLNEWWLKDPTSTYLCHNMLWWTITTWNNPPPPPHLYYLSEDISVYI